MEFSTELIGAVFKQAVIEIVAQQLESKVGDLEQGLRQLLKQAGAQALGCPCGATAQHQFRRSAKTLTVLGWVECRRAYYLCSGCHWGQYPLDQRLGLELGQVSAGPASLLGLAGVETAFEEGCELMERNFPAAVQIVDWYHAV